jgi:hypothetical protein
MVRVAPIISFRPDAKLNLVSPQLWEVCDKSPASRVNCLYRIQFSSDTEHLKLMEIGMYANRDRSLDEKFRVLLDV